MTAGQFAKNFALFDAGARPVKVTESGVTMENADRTIVCELKPPFQEVVALLTYREFRRLTAAGMSEHDASSAAVEHAENEGVNARAAAETGLDTWSVRFEEWEQPDSDTLAALREHRRKKGEETRLRQRRASPETVIQLYGGGAAPTVWMHYLDGDFATVLQENYFAALCDRLRREDVIEVHASTPTLKELGMVTVVAVSGQPRCNPRVEVRKLGWVQRVKLAPETKASR